MEPDKKELRNCIRLLAISMKFKPLPEERASQLIDHVLFKGEYDGVKGKDGWICFSEGIITEREIRNLLLAHSASKIAGHNNKTEPNCTEYCTKELCQKFELALLSKIVVPTAFDVLDPWEK